MDILVAAIWIFMAWYLPRLEEGVHQDFNGTSGKGAVKNLAQVYFQLGVMHESLKEYVKAVASYKETIRINPKYAPAYFKLGKNYILANRYQNAIKPLQQAIGLNPEETTSHIYLGWVNNQLGHHEEAAESLQKALVYSALCSSCGVRHHHYQNFQSLPAHADNEEKESILASLQKVEANESHSASFGNSIVEQISKTAVPVSFGNAITTEPAVNINSPKNDPGISSNQSDNPAENIAFDGVNLYDASLAVTFYRYGISHFKLEEYFPAIMELTEAIRLDPEFFDAHYALGLAYERLGMKKEAVQGFLAALKDKPAYHEAKFKLGDDISLSDLKRLLPEHFENADSTELSHRKSKVPTLKPRIPYLVLASHN